MQTCRDQTEIVSFAIDLNCYSLEFSGADLLKNIRFALNGNYGVVRDGEYMLCCFVDDDIAEHSRFQYPCCVGKNDTCLHSSCGWIDDIAEGDNITLEYLIRKR